MKNSVPFTPDDTSSRDDLLSSVTHLIVVGSSKGGVGKSFIATTCIDLLEIEGYEARVVQIDEQNRLPTLFPNRVQTVSLASLDDVRSDPAASITAFDGLYAEIEKTMIDKQPLVVDVGGLAQIPIEEYLGIADVDEDLAASGIRVLWLIPTTAEPESMRAAVRTAEAVGRVLPSARRTIVLNLRDGPFRFYPGSPADVLWRQQLEPFCRRLGAVELPVIAAGSWAPFEMAGKRFIDVVAADIDDIQSWTGRSRPASKVIRGDVAAFVAAADAALGPLLYKREETSNA